MRERMYLIHFFSYSDLLVSFSNVARTHARNLAKNSQIVYISVVCFFYVYSVVLSSELYKKINVFGKSFILAIINRNIFSISSLAAIINRNIFVTSSLGAKTRFIILVFQARFLRIIYQAGKTNILLINNNI
jgi:hypothetical protein